MHQGMYIAASGALNNLYRQDVAANNLANLSTPGFKPDTVLVRQRDAARIEGGLGNLSSNELLESLGAGVMGLRTHTGFGQGALVQTDNTLDLALQGDGFFVVQASSDESGDSQRLTRDGRFTLSSDGMLVTQDGMPVLDDSNDPIKLQKNQRITVEGDGTIRQGGAEVARLGVLDPADPQRLRKVGAGLFAAPNDVLNRAPTSSAIVRQNTVEQSVVDPIGAIMAVSSAGKAAEANIGMISRYDVLMERAINTFARLA